MGAVATEWLGTTEVAARLGVTLSTVYRLIDHNGLPAYRIGRVIRVRAEELAGFIEACRVQPGALAHLYPPSSGGDDDDGGGPV